MQPYDPNKRIVLMVHGLASSPEAWVNVANELMGDEELRKHFQVWQFYYPTNMPIALNHEAIRQTLGDAMQHLDPQRRRSRLTGRGAGGPQHGRRHCPTDGVLVERNVYGTGWSPIRSTTKHDWNVCVRRLRTFFSSTQCRKSIAWCLSPLPIAAPTWLVAAWGTGSAAWCGCR